MEILVIVFLILLNGIFSMAEMALVSSRKIRLEQAAKKGSSRAKLALSLAEHPNKFLSTVQIGITIIGILMGIFSGASLTNQLAAQFDRITVLAPFSHSLAVSITVVCITYFAIVFGELIPKRLGMTYPEKIAKGLSGFMSILSRITRPFVWLLTKSTDFVCRLFNIRPSDENRVTEEEIKAIIQEGKEGGEVQEIEQDIVERVFMLGDRRVSTLMTPRSQVIMLEGEETISEIIHEVTAEMHSIYPVYKEDRDHVIGVLKLKNLFTHIKNDKMRLEEICDPAHFILEKTTAFHALEKFKISKIHYGIVIDEYGQMQGIITLNDLLESLVGYSSDFYQDDYTLKEREDGSFLIDGHYPFPDFLHYFDLEHGNEEANFDTVGGLLLDELGRIPEVGDTLSWLDFKFEVMDMDGTRIDKILLYKVV